MNRLQLLFTILLAHIAILGVLTRPSAAQETRGTIQGQVFDSSQAVVPGAAVVATNKQTNIAVRATSNEAGNYTIPFLLPGMYRITAETEGFKAFVRDNIEIRVNDRLQVDITLEIGSTAETVEVTAETPLLDTVTANRGQIVDHRRITELPIPHGSFASLTWLASNQAHAAVWTSFRENQPTQNYALSSVSVEGAAVGTMDWTMDGVPNTQTSNAERRGVANSPPADMIQEFKMETNYDASVGHTSGSVVSVSLKSGANALHGTAYGFWRNSALNANSYTANLSNQPKRSFVYGRWGTTLSGPVRIPRVYNGQDKTFFSYGYEGLAQSLPQQYTGTVATEAQRRGDFSALLSQGAAFQIYDPATTREAPNGRMQRDPFPGNILPSSRLSPIGHAYLSYFPMPNTTGTARGESNYIQSQSPDWQRFYNHLLRIDHTINSRHRIYGRGAVSRKLDGPYGTYLGSLIDGGRYIGKNRNFVFDWVYAVTPSMIVNARYGYARYAGGQLSPEYFDLADLGFSENVLSLLDPRAKWFPRWTFPGHSSPNKRGMSYYNNDIHSFFLDTNVYRRNHNLKFGADLRADRNNRGNFTTIVPTFSFGSYLNGPLDNSPAAPIGQGLAGLLLGQPGSGSLTRNDTEALQSPYYGFYIQDDWRVTRKLTINLGFRWEYEGPMTERYNRSARSFDATVASPIDAVVRAAYAANPMPDIPASQVALRGGLLFAGLNGQPRGLWNPDRNNFAPRLGLAYQLRPNTVLRAGYGLYYIQLGQAVNTVSIQAGYSQATTLVPTLDRGVTYTATLENPFPDGVLSPVGPAGGIMTDAGRAISAFNPGIRSPYAQRWSFNIQHLLPAGFLLDAGYVGNRSTKLTVNRDMNALPNQYLSTLPVRDVAHINWLGTVWPNPFGDLLPGTSRSGATTSRATLLLPYPHFTSISIPTNQGYSWYHGMQVRSEKRFSRGFTTLLSYTWSKTMQATELLNAGDPVPYRVISPMDRTHSLSFSGIWELPLGQGRHFLSAAPPVIRQIVSGWQVGAIWLAMSGTPLSFGNVIFNGDIKNIPLPENERTYYRAFNTEAGFDRNSSNQLANNLRTFPLRFSGIRSDGYTTWDLSLIKQTRLTEKTSMQLRAEFLNAFNHPNFQIPNTSPVSSTFGRVPGENSFPREIQLALKFLF